MALTPAPRPGARSTSARRRGALPRRDHAARSLGPGGGTAGEVCLLLRAQDPLSASRRPGQVLSQAPSRPAAAPNLRVHPPKLLVIRTLAPEPHRLSAPLRAPRNSPPDTHHCPTPPSPGPSSWSPKAPWNASIPTPRPGTKPAHTIPDLHQLLSALSLHGTLRPRPSAPVPNPGPTS